MGGSADPSALDGSSPPCVMSLDGRFEHVNDALAEMLGLGRDELMKLGPLAVTHPGDRDRLVAMLGLMRAGSIATAKFRQRWLPAGRLPVETLVSGSVIEGDDGEPTAFAFTLQTTPGPDPGGEWESLFAHVHHALAVIGSDGRHVWVNDAYAALLGYAPAALVGMPWLGIVPGDCAPELERAHAKMLRHGRAWLATLGIRGDRSCFEAEIELVARDGPDGNPSGHLCLVRDIGARGEPADRSIVPDRFDCLTGLPDATEFVDRLEQMLTGAGEPSVSVLVLGVEAALGDTERGARNRRVDLLRAIAHRLEAKRGSAALLARLGDRSFALLLCTRDELTIAARVRCLLKATSQPFVASGEEHEVHATVGVAVATRGDDARELIDAADRARRRARELGSDRFELSELADQSPGSPAQQLSDDVRHAVRREELRLRYQPVFDMSDRSIRGVEALLRWEHSSRTVLPPEVFLPAARRTGAIVGIGRWVLEESLRQLERWNQELMREEPLRLFVNLSPRELADPSLLDSVQAAIERSAIEPEQLAVDVPGPALVGGPGAAWRSVVALRELGALVVLDQFGAALSSLADLEHFPIDMVKLDRSCVAGVAEDGSDRAIARAAVAVAEASGLTVSACGVETERQAKTLAALGCHTAQGFLFTEPRAGRAVTKLLRWNGARVGRQAS